MTKYDKKRLNKTKTTKNIMSCLLYFVVNLKTLFTIKNTKNTVSYLSYINFFQKDSLHNVNFCGICVNNKELL